MVLCIDPVKVLNVQLFSAINSQKTSMKTGQAEHLKMQKQITKRQMSNLPRECAAVVLELKNLPRPRSPSLTAPSAVIKTFAGLISATEIHVNLDNTRTCMYTCKR